MKRFVYVPFLISIFWLGADSTFSQNRLLITKGSIGSDHYPIYWMDLNGNNQTLVYDNGGSIAYARWSEDKSKIVYQWNEPPNWQVYTVNAGGGIPSRLTSDIGLYNMYPLFRSSSEIWYARGESYGTEIYKMDDNGNGKTPLSDFRSQGKEVGPFDIDIANGKVYYSVGNIHWVPSHEIFSSNTDLSNPVQLTYENGGDLYPRLSPSGRKLVWVHEEGPGGPQNVYTMNVDRSAKTKITNAVGNQYCPQAVWSPDGAYIIYSFFDGHQIDIYKVPAEGGTPENLTNTSNFNEIVWDCRSGFPHDGNTYTIIAAANSGGSIVPSGTIMVAGGASQSFTISSIIGYHVGDVLVDGSSVGAATSYAFTNVASNHTIEARFAADNPCAASRVLVTKGPVGSPASGLYTMNPNGNQQEAVIANLPIGGARWSGDNSKIAFSSTASTTGKAEIFIFDVATQGRNQLTFGSAYGNDNPVFRSPSKIWYNSACGFWNNEIFEVNTDGTGNTKLTDFLSQSKQLHANFDVDVGHGKLYYSLQDRGWAPSAEVYSQKLDFSDTRVPLTSESGGDIYPRLSPSGLKLVWVHEEGPGGPQNVYTMNVDGTGKTCLTNAVGHQYSSGAVWSPDETEIIYSFFDGNQLDIYKIPAGGGTPQNLTNTPGYHEYVLDWKSGLPGGSPLSITGQPSNSIVCAGASVTFSVTATGIEPLQYQWRKGGIPIPNAPTASSYVIQSSTSEDAGTYDVVVTNACGSITSSPATLVVNTPAVVTLQPGDQTVVSGASVKLVAAGRGTPPLSVHWELSTDGGATFSDIAGATNAELTLNAVTTTQNGYQYRAVFSNVCNDAMSNAAHVTVLPPANIYVYSALHTVGSGTKPPSIKTPLAIQLKVFDKTKVPPPDPKDFGTIWESGPGLGSLIAVISGPQVVDIGNGQGDLYTIIVPSYQPLNTTTGGSYLVVGKATINSTDFYIGSPTDPLETGSVTQKHLQVVQNGGGKAMAAKTTAIPGSLLLVTEPECLEFTSDQELMPIIYESIEGDWKVTVHAEAPEGFVSNPGAMSADIPDSSLQAVQFTIKDVGSSWTTTKLTHNIKHKGKDITLTSETRMVNKKNGKGGNVASNGDAQVEAISSFIPTDYVLYQNYPDPFNPSTQIEFDLAEYSQVRVAIYDILGRKIITLADGVREAGRYHKTWEGMDANGNPVVSGVYFLRMTAQSMLSDRHIVAMKKMMLLR
jgi:Tol biopolymer transport system component